MGLGASGSATATGGTGQTQAASSSASTLTQPGGALNENTFLQLLVAQMQYQDPMQPVNSTQFVTQLAQFQMLSVLMAMQKDLDTLVAAQTGGGSGSASTTSGSGSGTGSGSGSASSTGAAQATGGTGSS